MGIEVLPFFVNTFRKPSKESYNRCYMVKPAPHAKLTAEQRRLIDRLDRFEAPYLQERLLKCYRARYSRLLPPP